MYLNKFNLNKTITRRLRTLYDYVNESSLSHLYCGKNIFHVKNKEK